MTIKTAVLLISMILLCGCLGTDQSAKQSTITPAPVQYTDVTTIVPVTTVESIKDYTTFVPVNRQEAIKPRPHSSGNGEAIVETQVNKASANDPIIGKWSLVNWPYPCIAITGVGSGHITCSIAFISQSRDLTWTNRGNNTYEITTSSGESAVALLSSDNNIITSDLLPSGSFLQRTVF